MSRWDHIPNSTDQIRNGYAQRQVHERANSDREDVHATHYVGLQVGLALNRRLPGFAQRTDHELRRILNVRENLGRHLASTNLGLHNRVDQRIMNHMDNSSLTNEEYNRLLQITRHAQSAEFQEAVIENNAKQWYLALRDRVQSFDTGGRPSVWDARRDRRELQREV